MNQDHAVDIFQYIGIAVVLFFFFVASRIKKGVQEKKDSLRDEDELSTEEEDAAAFKMVRKPLPKLHRSAPLIPKLANYDKQVDKYKSRYETEISQTLQQALAKKEKPADSILAQIYQPRGLKQMLLFHEILSPPKALRKKTMDSWDS